MKRIILMAMAAAMMCGCEKELDKEPIQSDMALPTGEVVKTKKFSFTLKGDFTSEWKSVTRANEYMSADGKEMTDVWVLDYMGGTLIQQLHQTNTDEEFGAPVMNLAYGSHHVYIIASRGQNPTLNTTDHTISFTNVRDTFYKDYSVDVVSTSNGNRAVTLYRVVTRLRLTFTDAVDNNASTINFVPHTWYFAWDYINAAPVNAATDHVVTITIPDSEKGNTGVQANFFGFSTADQWTTNVAINSKKSDNTVIGSATIANAPFKANRISEYAGPLFSSDGAVTLSIDSNWDDAYNGVW